MSSIGIYMEGGGESTSNRAKLRGGMDEFLGTVKRQARELRWRWKLSCWGSREATFRRFRGAVRNNEHALALLLVDAEGPVRNQASQHLAIRDEWDTAFASESSLHLMVQTMETWIVADPSTLAGYYGNGFRQSALPQRPDLESIPKKDIERRLERATQHTKKGRYHKIHHASALLAQLKADTVRANCPHCDRLFQTLEESIFKAKLYQ